MLHTILTLPFALLLSTCTTGQDLDADTSVSDSSPMPQAIQGNPIELAQYPSAPFEDSNGNFWFSTVLKGLIRYDGKEFVAFTTEHGLASNLIRGVQEDEDGILWIATNGGVCTYDGKAFTTLTDYGDIPITHTFTELGDHLDIWEVLKDSRGQVWIATLDGVFKYDGKTFTPFPLPVVAKAPSFEFTPKMVYSIYEDKDGALWFGTDGAGAVKYDGTNMTVYTEKDNGLCSDRVCTILQDRRGDFWFGTSSGGVSRYDGSTFTTHLRSSTYSEFMGWGRFMAIHEDKAGDVWFGVCSTGGGVHRYDGKSFRYFSKKDGLSDGRVPSIREDRSGALWFGTTAGVFRFDGERFVNFTKS